MFASTCICSWWKCESPQFDVVWMTGGITHSGEQMGSGVQAEREQRIVVCLCVWICNLKRVIKTSTQRHKSSLKGPCLHAPAVKARIYSLMSSVWNLPIYLLSNKSDYCVWVLFCLQQSDGYVVTASHWWACESVDTSWTPQGCTAQQTSAILWRNNHCILMQISILNTNCSRLVHLNKNK